MIAKKKGTAKKRAAAKQFKADRAAWRETKGKIPPKDPAYLDWVRTLPCFACKLLGMRQEGPSEAAHLGEIRGLRQKAPDTTAGPLCSGHHRTGPVAHHRIGRFFWSYLGLDRDELITTLNRGYKKYLKEKEPAE